MKIKTCDNVIKSEKLTPKLRNMMYQITLRARFTPGATANFKNFYQLP